jgi:hypothetical protein
MLDQAHVSLASAAPLSQLGLVLDLLLSEIQFPANRTNRAGSVSDQTLGKGYFMEPRHHPRPPLRFLHSAPGTTKKRKSSALPVTLQPR